MSPKPAASGSSPVAAMYVRRDLPPPGHAELLPQDVGVSLRRARRDAETFAHFLVRAPGGDQLDDLSLLLA